ncbi:hypothetical protein PF002_g29861 [Phytophthora fragariae]|nr:hypothetical protein PF003_g27508 [Phytophthora fragariae]KAE8919176.1 hypothetical protein PF009_g30511 [Phytophthora fragariae]KAE8958660.1 hypothetical protein PF011_g30685 [Phytophthora fragariae]KAE9064274.1 hypothetical protein PF007_g29254 [Phytophthora fragariae]KAE9069794.1 hypothetical protein PF006_g29494 [Phytophthora fragariae]
MKLLLGRLRLMLWNSIRVATSVSALVTYNVNMIKELRPIPDLSNNLYQEVAVKMNAYCAKLRSATTHHVGDGWGEVLVASRSINPDQIELLDADPVPHMAAVNCSL